MPLAYRHAAPYRFPIYGPAARARLLGPLARQRYQYALAVFLLSDGAEIYGGCAQMALLLCLYRLDSVCWPSRSAC
jgi:hypothetical protein